MLVLLAGALGILARDEDGRWTATGLGRGCATLTLLPPAQLDGAPPAEASLIGTPGSPAEPGFVVRVSLPRLRVWRRLRLLGQLTAYGLHALIQAPVGWGGDPLPNPRGGA